MKTYKGLDAVKYIVDNKDKVLYNKSNTAELYFDTTRGILKLCKNGEHMVANINEVLLGTEWYTEKRGMYLITIYIDGKLCASHIEKVYDKDLSKTMNGLCKFYRDKYNVKSVQCQCEMYYDIMDVVSDKEEYSESLK